MSKTARDVIKAWGLDEEQYEKTDALIAELDAAGFVIVPKGPTEDHVDSFARAIKDCVAKFHSPVDYYIAPESRYRWKDKNPDGDPYLDHPEKDWDFESYRIVARAALAAQSP